MRSEIDTYLREHGARYTTEALRSRLIAAGHDPAEVNAALEKTAAARSAELAETRSLTSRFWRWAIGLHVAVLVLVGLLVLNHGRGSFFGVYLVGVEVLGVAMVIGLVISGLLGRRLMHRGLEVALLGPITSALLLGGTCLIVSGTVTL